MTSQIVLHVKRIVVWLYQLAARFFRFLLGDVSWSPPPWVMGIDRLILFVAKKLTGWQCTHRKAFWGTIGALALVAASSYGGWKYYQSLPKPQRFSLSGTSPSPTRLEKDAQPDKLYIDFSGSTARIEQVGKAVTQGITMSPLIKGEWTWETDSRLCFSPQEDWGVGQKYTVSFARELFPKHVLLEKYQHSFVSAPFVLILAKSEFYTDPRDPKIKKVLVSLKATHPIDEKSLKDHVKLVKKIKRDEKFVLTDEKVPFTLSFDEFKGMAYIHSETLSVPLEEYYVVVKISEGVRSSRGGDGTQNELTTDVRIPGMYDYFRINASEATFVRNKQYEPEQVLVIETTAGARQEDITKNLQVYLLPQDRPAFQGQPAQQNYRWWNASEIGTEVLNLSKPITLKPIPTEQEFSTLHSFKYHADIGRFLFVKIKKDIRSYGDYILAKTFEQVVQVPEMPKELTILHDGSILSLTGKRTISIMARDIETVKFELGRVLPSQINHLVSQTSGAFQKPDFNYAYYFNEDNLTDRFEEVRVLQKLEKGKSQYLAFDFSPYLQTTRGETRGLFFFKVNGWDSEKKRVIEPEDQRFILITDLGVVVKTAVSGASDVFVVSLSSGKPVEGAQVEVLGKNGLPIVSNTTNALGHVTLPPLKDFEREKAPTVFLVRKEKDLSFIPYDRNDRVLNLSRFEIGGRYSAESPDELQAYLFSDRGIYRPGDSFHVGIIVKPPVWEKNIENIPLKVFITDPGSRKISEKTIALSPSGFEEIAYTTQENSPTGNYEVSVYIVGEQGKLKKKLGSTTVRVEEFLPDRLRIEAQLSRMSAEGWVSPKGLKGVVNLQNLFGTPAAKRLVTAKIQLLPWSPAFRLYQDYQFFDPLKAEHVYTESVPEGRTDEQGKAELDLDLKRFKDATYRLTFLAEGYEAEGGRAVRAQASVLVSPNEYLIGYKPDGDLKYISKDSKRSVHLIAVNPDLKMIVAQNLKAHLIELRYVSVLTKQESGVYKYESVEKEITVSKENLMIPEQGLRYQFPTNEPGDYALIVKNDRDTELSRITFSVVGTGDLSRSLEKNAELQVKLNKNDFAPGEDIEMEIRAPYTGTGLITIEQDKVSAFKWFMTRTTNTVQTITVPKDLEGNAYVNVSFVRDLASPEIYMSPLSYGVVPFSISRKRRTNKITLVTPDLARPGEKLSIRYKTERPAKIVIYAVDEGILQVARYKTPKPLDYFFAKKALEVKTAQILDLILPEFDSARLLSAVGGDAEGALGANLNPFKRKQLKPVAYWSGIIDSGPEEQEVSYAVPDYFNGTIKIMAMAVAQDSLGVAEQKSLVRGHFVISPNVPTFVAPGDEFVVSVSVANNVNGSGDKASVNFALTTSDHVKILDKSTRILTVGEGREETTTYKLKAKSLLGSATLTFCASWGDKTSKYSLDLSLRPPNPYVTKVQTGYFKKGTVKIPVTRSMYPQFRTLEASGSILPVGLARGLIQYLDKFPYGCTEQVVSQAFPALILNHRREFGYKPEQVEATLEKALNILRARQNTEGAFGFWAANSFVSDFQTVYATHFLTEAKEKGYPIPPDMLTKALDYLSDLRKQIPASLPDARIHAYAIYLRTRNGIVTTNELDLLLNQLREKFPKTWEKDLTSIYIAATFKLLKKDTDAEKFISNTKLEAMQESDYNDYYDSLTRNAQVLFVLCKHFPERAQALKGSDLECMVKPIIKGTFNTTSSAYSILALDAYADIVGLGETEGLTIAELLPQGKRNSLTLPKGLFPASLFSPEAEAIQFSCAKDHLIFYQIIEAGFDQDLPTAALKQNLEVQREYSDESGKTVTSAKLGDKLIVHLKIRAIENGSYENIAVVDLLPGGFEVELTPGSERANDSEKPLITPPLHQSSYWQPQYVDMREDRVVVFGEVSPTMNEFIYTIRATNQGTYRVPPVFAESMYDRSMQAKGLGGKVVVEGR